MELPSLQFLKQPSAVKDSNLNQIIRKKSAIMEKQLTKEEFIKEINRVNAKTNPYHKQISSKKKSDQDQQFSLNFQSFQMPKNLNNVESQDNSEE